MVTHADRTYGDDVPDEVVDRLREICADLPDASEEVAWKGVRWRIRTRTFAHTLTVQEGDADPHVVITFRAEGDDLEMLRHVGPPIYVLGWADDALGIVVDDDTDWTEVAELVTDSYCVMAPKKLAAQVPRPPQ